MAADSFTVTNVPTGVTNTLTGTTADAVTVTSTGQACRINVLNRSSSNTLHVRPDGVTAVADADGTLQVPAGGSVEWQVGPGVSVVSIVGNGDSYSVTGIPQSAWV